MDQLPEMHAAYRFFTAFETNVASLPAYAPNGERASQARPSAAARSSVHLRTRQVGWSNGVPAISIRPDQLGQT